MREAIKLEGLPLEVHIVADGEQAINFVARAEADPAAPGPHILLVDLNLPRVDGFEVLRKIRASAKFKDLPVLVVTSSNSPTDRKAASQLGARYFQKPVTYEEFIIIGAYLRSMLVEHGLLKEQ